MAEANRHHRETLIDTWQRAIEDIHQAARDRDDAFRRALESGSEAWDSYGLKLGSRFDPGTAAALNLLRNGDNPDAVEIDWAITPPPILKAVGS